MKKILLAGINGQLGSALNKRLSGKFDVYGIGTSKKDHESYFVCDIRDKKKIEGVFDKVHPEIVINAAAIANADFCETEKERAYSINYIGNNNLMQAAIIQKSFFIFISSYYVFDGRE